MINKAKEMPKCEGKKVIRHMLNTMAEVFAIGEETSSTHKSYTRQILNIEDPPDVEGEGETQAPGATIAFSKKDATSIHHHKDDHMVITVKCNK